jgi:hypothetical protein
MQKEPVRKPPFFLRQPWPPTDFREKHPVTPADNWWTLQSRFGLSTVWHIIVYNFETRDPDIVNWYMYEKLGCRLTTEDGANYRFGRSPGKEDVDPAKPIYIYIPHEKWVPATMDDDNARAYASTALTTPPAEQVHFQYNRLYPYLPPNWTGKIAKLIDEGRIGVRYAPTLPGDAMYVSGKHAMYLPNTMYLSFAVASAENTAGLIHESLHAWFDYKRTTLKTPVVEGLCYVAQSLYLIKRGIRGRLGDASDTAMDAIFANAWTIASALDGGGPVLLNDIENLENSVGAHPSYAERLYVLGNGIP